MKTIEEGIGYAHDKYGKYPHFRNGFKAGVEFAQRLEFMPISGYEGIYEISNRGDVRSLERKSGNNKNTKLNYLARFVNKNGYVHVGLTNKLGIRKNYDIHRLVAISFVSNPEDKLEVNHKDGNKSNNIWTNLEWVTRSENSKHAFLNGLKKPTKYWKGKKGSEHHSSIKVQCVNDMKIFDSIKQAAEYYKLDRCSISLVCKGKLKTNGKLKFIYFRPIDIK